MIINIYLLDIQYLFYMRHKQPQFSQRKIFVYICYSFLAKEKRKQGSSFRTLSELYKEVSDITFFQPRVVSKIINDFHKRKRTPTEMEIQEYKDWLSRQIATVYKAEV